MIIIKTWGFVGMLISSLVAGYGLGLAFPLRRSSLTPRAGPPDKKER